MNNNKDILLAAYNKLDSSDSPGIRKLIKEIASYTNTHGEDTDLLLLTQLLTLRLEEINSRSITKCRNWAIPIIETLENNTPWNMHKIAFLSYVVCYAPYKKAIQLATEAIQQLDTLHHNEKSCKSYKGIIYVNLTYALSIAFCYDISPSDKDTGAEIRQLFEQYMALAEEAYEYSNKKNDIVLTMLGIRKALFASDYEIVDAGVDKLRKMKNANWLSLVCDEVAAFVALKPHEITAETLRYIIGHRIKKRRKKLGMSALELADLIGTGVTQHSISGYECGRKGFSFLDLYRISRALDVGIDYFFNMDDDREWPPIPVPASAITPEMDRLISLLEPLPQNVNDFTVEVASEMLALYNRNIAKGNEGI